MSSGLGIDYAADHAEMETDRGVSVFLRGRTVSALVSIPEESRTFEDDATGFYRESILRISMRNAVIPNHGSNPPKAGEIIRYEGDNYRIARVIPDAPGNITMYECESEAQ